MWSQFQNVTHNIRNEVRNVRDEGKSVNVEVNNNESTVDKSKADEALVDIILANHLADFSVKCPKEVTECLRVRGRLCPSKK